MSGARELPDESPLPRAGHPTEAQAAEHAMLMARAAAARQTSIELSGLVPAGARSLLALTLGADAEAPGRAREAVGQLARRAGVGPEQLDAVATVVSELVTNAVRHAYDDEPGPVQVEAAVLGRRLVLIVADEGRGPRVASPRPGLGFGWKLVAQLAEDMTIVQRGMGGTEVRARLGLDPAPS